MLIGLKQFTFFQCCTVSVYRQDAAKRQTAGSVCTHRPKITFFAPHGRLVAPIQVKLSKTDGHMGPLGCAKLVITSVSAEGWECGSKISEVSTSWYRVAPQARLPWPISKLFWGFYTPDYPTLVFQISCDSLHRLRIY